MPEDELRAEGTIGEISNARMMSNDIGISSREPDDQQIPDDQQVTDEIMPNKHNVTIHSLDFGYNVKIGCQNFAVETVEKLIKNLEAFLNDPRGTERKWTKERKLL